MSSFLVLIIKRFHDLERFHDLVLSSILQDSSYGFYHNYSLCLNWNYLLIKIESNVFAPLFYEVFSTFPLCSCLTLVNTDSYMYTHVKYLNQITYICMNYKFIMFLTFLMSYIIKMYLNWGWLCAGGLWITWWNGKIKIIIQENANYQPNWLFLLLCHPKDVVIVILFPIFIIYLIPCF
jgi:hypothetical protein